MNKAFTHNAQQYQLVWLLSGQDLISSVSVMLFPVTQMAGVAKPGQRRSPEAAVS
jgi:hypothetical protein